MEYDRITAACDATEPPFSTAATGPIFVLGSVLDSWMRTNTIHLISIGAFCAEKRLVEHIRIYSN